MSTIDANLQSEAASSGTLFGTRVVTGWSTNGALSDGAAVGISTNYGFGRGTARAFSNMFGGLSYESRDLVPAMPINFGTLSSTRVREGEQYLLPDWFARDHDNQGFLEAMWHALEATDPEFAAEMLHLKTAPYPYLDTHGAVYGVDRGVFELDDSYRQRILCEVLIVRSRAPGIRDYVMCQAGISIRLYDPKPFEARGCNINYLDGTWSLDGSVTLGCVDYLWHYLDGTWSLDGSVTLSTFTLEAIPGEITTRHPPATFLVDILDANGDQERALDKVNAAKDAIDRSRAAGMIPVYGLEMFLWAYWSQPDSHVRKHLTRRVYAYFGNQHVVYQIESQTGETIVVDTINNRGALPSNTPQPAPPESVDALATERYSQGYASGYNDGLDRARNDLVNSGVLTLGQAQSIGDETNPGGTLTFADRVDGSTTGTNTTSTTSTPTTPQSTPVAIPRSLAGNYDAGFDAGYQAGFGDGSSNGPRYPSFPGQAGRFFLSPNETNQPIFRLGSTSFFVFDPKTYYKGTVPTLSRLRKHLRREGYARFGYGSSIRAYETTPLIVPTPRGETTINLHVDNRDDTYDGFGHWRLVIYEVNVHNTLDADGVAIARLSLFSDDNTIDKTQDSNYFDEAFSSSGADPALAFTPDLLPQWQATETTYPQHIGVSFKLPLLVHAYRVQVVERVIEIDPETGLETVLERFASPRKWTLQASHDGELWTDIHTAAQQAQWTIGEERLFVIGNDYSRP